MALIHVHDLEKTYPDGTQALRGVSFDIKEGDKMYVKPEDRVRIW